jgi:hypothetical protein
MIDTPEKREISREEATNALQTDILNSLQELKDLQNEIGHGEVKRLDLAIAAYPLMEEDFSHESEAMRKSYSAHKRITDAKIALGVEVTLEAMLKQQLEEQRLEQGEANELKQE